MGSQEEIKIEEDFILIRFQNDEDEVFRAERQINQGLIQFHFGIKGRAKFIFNQGNYALDLKEEKSLLLYNPQKELPLDLELAPNSWVISVIISIQKFLVRALQNGLLNFFQKWGVNQAIEWMKELAPFKLHWIEEPTSPDDIMGHKAISQALKPYGKHCSSKQYD